MSLYKVHNDYSKYQSLTFDIDDYLDLLDPSIGEREAMLLPSINKPISHFWQPIELGYFANEGTTEFADVSIWKSGLILMNAKAYKSLNAVLKDYGEFLPCELHEQPAFIFNALVLKAKEAAIVSYKTKNGHLQQVESIAFDSTCDEPVFKHQDELSFNLYCSEAFKQACEIGQLKGIYFSSDLAAPL